MNTSSIYVIYPDHTCTCVGEGLLGHFSKVFKQFFGRNTDYHKRYKSILEDLQ